MNYYVSLSTTSGNTSNLMKRMPLSDALKFVVSHPFDNKQDCWLLSNGYKDTTALYTREEFNFQFIDTILLDVDNDEEHPNPDLLEQFKKDYADYSYFLWESASSTTTCPKFRVLMPLDKRVAWVNEPAKFTKKAVLGLFDKYTDNKASWYFSPTTAKVNTFVGHKGSKLFPSKLIEDRIQVDRMFAQINEQARRAREERRPKTKTHNPEGWRKFDTVIKCFKGLSKGERDNSLNAACWAMEQNGFKDKIPQFLSEVDCEEALKNKFRRQYH